MKYVELFKSPLQKMRYKVNRHWISLPQYLCQITLWQKTLIGFSDSSQNLDKIQQTNADPGVNV